jgi:hypothetical protein
MPSTEEAAYSHRYQKVLNCPLEIAGSPRPLLVQGAAGQGHSLPKLALTRPGILAPGMVRVTVHRIGLVEGEPGTA